MLRKAIARGLDLWLRGHARVNRVLTHWLRSGRGDRPAPYVVKMPAERGSVRIVHANGNFAVGGSTQLIVDLIEGLSSEYAHEVIVPDYPEPLPYQPVDIARYSLDQLTNLHRTLTRNPPAAVHVHYWVREGDGFCPGGVWYATIFRMCEDLEIPVIQNINVPTEPFPSRAVVKNVFVSHFVLNNFNTESAPAIVIHPGSDFTHFRSRRAGLPNDTVGMVYRLDEDKLAPESIEVFIEVVRRRPSVRCLIVGGGTYLALYKDRVRQESMDENFEFTGFVSYAALPHLYERLGVFVAPVHNESFGQVTPFAMGMGLCVAGYDTGAISEILNSKETLVAYGDAAALAEKIVQLLDDDHLREKLGSANRQRAHRLFSVEKMVGEYRRVYREHVPSRR